MKWLIAGIFSLLTTFFVVASVTGFAEFAVVNSSTSAPAQVTNARIEARSVLLIGKKSTQTSNTTAVYISVSGQSANGAQSITIDPGAWAIINPNKSDKYVMLSNIWFDVTTANDGLIVIYE